MTIRIVSFLCLLCAGTLRAQTQVSSPYPGDVPEIYQPLYWPRLSDEGIKNFLSKLPYESISLQRTECLGPCPVYTVTFHRSGKAELLAKRHLPKTEEFVGTIDPYSYGRLCLLVDKIGFQDLKNEYEAKWTDAASCIVTVRTSAQKEKRIDDYGDNGPIELWALQRVIDHIQTEIQWKSKQ